MAGDTHTAPDVTAVVLTHMRPRLATATVRMLVEDEGLAPNDVIVVVNQDGGLNDPALEKQVDLVRLTTNLGPAGGFAFGMRRAFETSTKPWVYVCEDDITLLSLPTPRLEELIGRATADGDVARPIGAIVAYGRDLDPRTGRTIPHTPPRVDTLQPVAVAAWGATLVYRSVLEAGIAPDPALFFGYEDFDFFLSVQRAGFRVVVDPVAARAVGDQVTERGRSTLFTDERPADPEEPWRHYYRARNFIALSRRHGTRRWRMNHLALCARRWQLDGHSWTVARAILHGVRDGYAERLGQNPRWQRSAGEFDQTRS